MKNEIFLICHSALIWSQPVLSNRNLLASSPNDINWVGVQSINITCENNPVREGCSAGNIRIKTFKCTDREANNSIYAVNAEQHIKQISSDGSGLFMFKEDQKQNFQSCTTSKCSRGSTTTFTIDIFIFLHFPQLLGLLLLPCGPQGTAVVLHRRNTKFSMGLHHQCRTF